MLFPESLDELIAQDHPVRVVAGKGSSRQAALRALAFKWIRILFRCWKNRTPYDESRYLEALKKRNSPLLAILGTENTEPKIGKSVKGRIREHSRPSDQLRA